MKKLFSLMLLSVFLMGTAHADWDYELEAKEAAQRKAEQQKADQEKAKADAMKQQAMDKANADMKREDQKSVAAMRKSLGKSANGKSDAEVKKMYQAKAMAEFKEGQAKEVASRPMKDAQMKKMYGKDTQELMNMSEEELDKFSKDMEKKYGQ